MDNSGRRDRGANRGRSMRDCNKNQTMKENRFLGGAPISVAIEKGGHAFCPYPPPPSLRRRRRSIISPPMTRSLERGPKYYVTHLSINRNQLSPSVLKRRRRQSRRCAGYSDSLCVLIPLCQCRRRSLTCKKWENKDIIATIILFPCQTQDLASNTIHFITRPSLFHRPLLASR